MGDELGLTRRELFVVKHRLGMIPEQCVKISKREENKLYKSAQSKLERIFLMKQKICDISSVS